MKISLFAIITLVAFLVQSQETVNYRRYNWETDIKMEKYESSVNHDKEATIVLYKRGIINTGKTVEDISDKRMFYHKIIWIENESAIDKINKLYLGENARKGGQLSVSFRVIDTNNMIRSLEINAEDQIKDIEQNGRKYKIVAIPGIEKQCWLEIFYSYNRSKDSFQDRIILDEPFDIAHAEVVVGRYAAIPSLDYLYDLSKGYNGFKLDEERSDDHTKVYEVDSVYASSSEAYRHEYKWLPRVDFRSRKATWEEIGTSFWRHGILPQSKSEIIRGHAFFKKILKSLGKKDASKFEKMVAFEEYVKSNIVVSFDGEYIVDKILDSKTATDFGLAKLYYLFFAFIDLDNTLYLSSDDDYLDLDKEFPYESSLQSFLFHLTEQDVYLDPANDYYRLGRIPNYFSECRAMLIMKNGKNGEGSIVRLPSANKDYNYEFSVSETAFDIEKELTASVSTKKYYGDRAIRTRAAIHYSEEGEGVGYVERLLLSKMENSTLKNVSLKNESIELNVQSKDTLYVEGQIESEEIVTPLGNGYMVGIPMLIGWQTSVYTEAERNSKIYIEQSKVYDHKLMFTIPEGYHLENIENHNFERVFEKKGREIAAFRSKASIEGNQLVLTVHEFYERGFYAPEYYADFQAVINGAYEFYISKCRLVENE